MILYGHGSLIRTFKSVMTCQVRCKSPAGRHLVESGSSVNFLFAGCLTTPDKVYIWTAFMADKIPAIYQA